MEFSVTLNYGSLDAEFQGGDREDIENEVLEFIEFLEKNEEKLNGVVTIEERRGGDSGGNGAAPHSHSRSTDSVSGGDGASDDHELAPIAREVDATIEELEELIYVSVEGDDLPLLLIDDLERLGDTVPDKQANTAMAILFVWEKVYGEEKMLVSDMKDVFSRMGISTSHTHRAWDKSYFTQPDKGGGTKLKLRRGGKREARTLLEGLVEDEPE